MTVNANSCEGNFFSLREEYQLMHGGAYDDYSVGNEEATINDPKTFFGYVDLKKKRQLCILKVVWHLVLKKSAIFLMILNNEHMLMMYGCL
jgi:hypothetical protein